MATQEARNLIVKDDGITNANLLALVNGSETVLHSHAGGEAGSGGNSGPIIIYPWFYNSIVQGTWSMGTGASYLYNGVATSTGANADEINYKVYMDAGTYTLKIMWTRWTANGILDYYIDAAEVASVDTYGTLVYNNVTTVTGIVVAASGIKTIKIKVDGKNASSSGYGYNVQPLLFYRTA